MGEITDLRPQHAGSENRLESPSLVNLAVEAICDRILAGNLQPGERLHEEFAVHGERSFDATVVRRHGPPLPDDEAATR